MDNLCNNCIHKDVCGRYAATWGMKTCENFLEKKKGKWKYYHKQNIAVCTNCSFERDLDANFGRAITCPNCGTDMRGDQCE